ncbi:MAG TPA: hypothetical protein VGN77_07085 [Steroidobacteraceae bacterium]|nr:hypothetical protein [Steroidobacteraceae bacterium]
MNTNIITRQIGIGMLAFCATFVQTTMFATSHFGGSANTQSVHASDARIADSTHQVATDAANRV